MALILHIETATTNCSVALAKEGELLAIKEVSNGYSHAENLHVFIRELLNSQELAFEQLDAIAVSKGPGSYTGLRIGVSAAKGLCFALDKPLIAVDTLQTLAMQVSGHDGLIVPMIDARRMEAYTAVFNGRFDKLREIKAEVLTEESFVEELSTQQVVFIGNAVEKTQDVISNENAEFRAGVLPSAREMCPVAFEAFKRQDFEDVAYFEPYYLKDFIVTPPKKK